MGSGNHIPEWDIAHYFNMLLFLEDNSYELGSEAEHELKRYGANAEEIKETIEGHLAECQSCKEFYESLGEVHRLTTEWREAPLPLKFLEPILPKKFWRDDHTQYHAREGLEAYLIGKAVAETIGMEHEPNPTFESHMGSCDSCQRFYRIYASFRREILTNRDTSSN